MAITDSLQNFELTSFVSNLPTNEITTIVFLVARTLFWVALVGAVAWFVVIQPLLFNIKVTIFEKRHGNTVIYHYRGFIKKKLGEQKFRIYTGIFKPKLHLPIPVYDDIILDVKGKSNVYYVKEGENFYSTLHPKIGDYEVDDAGKLKQSDVNFKVHDTVSLRWLMEEVKGAIIRHRVQSQFQQYIAPAMLIVGFMFILIMLWLTLGTVGDISNALGSASNKMADAVKDFGRQIVESR